MTTRLCISLLDIYINIVIIGCTNMVEWRMLDIYPTTCTTPQNRPDCKKLREAFSQQSDGTG